MRRATVAGMLLVLLGGGCGGETGPPEVTLSGSLTDPAGDGGVADIVSARIEVMGNDMVLTVDFTAATFHGDSMQASVNLDTDENPATGYTTVNPGHVAFGIDCAITLGKLTGTTFGVQAKRWENTAFVPVANGTLRVLANRLEGTVPADVCEDDGPALFKVDAFRQVTNIGFTVRQDWAPDPGQPAATLR